jgi:pyrrolidone-carboxylate peptidase
MEHKRAYESVILTGFQTFGSHTKNPTEELITSISEEEMKAHRILKKMALDVTCKDVDCFTSDLTKELDKIKPGEQVLLIHMGVGPNQIYHLE